MFILLVLCDLCLYDVFFSLSALSSGQRTSILLLVWQRILCFRLNRTDIQVYKWWCRIGSPAQGMFVLLVLCDLAYELHDVFFKKTEVHCSIRLVVDLSTASLLVLSNL